MARTTAPAFKAALYAALQGLALADVDVVYSMPSRKIGKDHIMLGGMRSDEQPARLGNLEREENYDLEVTVRSVRAFIDDPQTVAERAFDVYGEVEDLLRSDMTVGGVVLWAQPAGWELDETADNEAGWRDARVVARIRCRARI